MGPVRQNPIHRTVRSVHVCALHCAQLLHTILHRTDLIVFPLTLQTITSLGKRPLKQCVSSRLAKDCDGSITMSCQLCSNWDNSWRRLQRGQQRVTIYRAGNPWTQDRRRLFNHTTTILRPFFLDHLGEPVPDEKLMVQGKINRGRHTDHLAGSHSIQTNQCPPPPSPIFYRPDALSAAQPTVSKHWRLFNWQEYFMFTPLPTNEFYVIN